MLGTITPYSVALYPLYGGVLDIIDVGLGLLVGLLAIIAHLYLLYIGRRHSHFSHRIILSCLVYIVHCVRKFYPQIGLIFISDIHFLGMDYSLIIYFFSFYAISGTWLHKMNQSNVEAVSILDLISLFPR